MVHNIICETTVAIFETLKGTVFPKISQSYFQQVAEGFEKRWNFPHCIGAIDGKHVVIQVNNNSYIYMNVCSLFSCYTYK